MLHGAVGSADHIIDLLEGELSGKPLLWATGGWGPAMAERCSHKFRVCPELTLTGIDEIGERNRKEGR